MSSIRVVLSALFLALWPTAAQGFEFRVVSSFRTDGYEIDYPVTSVAVDPESGVLLLGTLTEVVETYSDGTDPLVLIDEERIGIGYFDRGLAVAPGNGMIFGLGIVSFPSSMWSYTRTGDRLADAISGGTNSYHGLHVEASPDELGFNLHFIDRSSVTVRWASRETGRFGGLVPGAGTGFPVLWRDNRRFRTRGIAYIPGKTLYLGAVDRSGPESDDAEILAMDRSRVAAGVTRWGRVAASFKLEAIGIHSVSDLARHPWTGHIFLVDPSQSRIFELEVFTSFVRGDINNDGRINISDAVDHLDSLFRGGTRRPCDDAADTNDDGRLDLSDAVVLLNRLFRGADPAAMTFRCETDDTPDDLGCGVQQLCPPDQGGERP